MNKQKVENALAS